MSQKNNNEWKRKRYCCGLYSASELHVLLNFTGEKDKSMPQLVRAFAMSLLMVNLYMALFEFPPEKFLLFFTNYALMVQITSIGL